MTVTKRYLGHLLTTLISLAASPAFATQPQISEIKGELNQAEIEQALKPLDSWFQRAEKLCKDRTGSECRIKLKLEVDNSGRNPNCSVAYSGIPDPYSQYTYCAVAVTARFPAKPNTSSFALFFNVDPKGEGFGEQTEKPPAKP